MNNPIKNEKFYLKIAGYIAGVTGREKNPFNKLIGREYEKIYNEGFALGKEDALKRYKQFKLEFL